jgi:hypothetical protein
MLDTTLDGTRKTAELCFNNAVIWRGLGPVSISDDYRNLRRFAISELDTLSEILFCHCLRHNGLI